MRFRHTCLIINDLSETLDFYTKILGMAILTRKTLEREYPEKILGIKNIKLTYIKLGSITNWGNCSMTLSHLELIYYHYPKYRNNRNNLNHVAFTIGNLKEKYIVLNCRGVEFISEPVKAPDSSCLVCFCRDPSNNLLEFVEEL